MLNIVYMSLNFSLKPIFNDFEIHHMSADIYNSCLLGICFLFFLFWSLCIRQISWFTNVCVHCDYLHGKKIPEMELLCQRLWAFLRLLIYIANLPSAEVVPIYSSFRTLYSVFMKMTEQLQEARLEQDLKDQHVHLCVHLLAGTIDKDTEDGYLVQEHEVK